MKVRLLPKPINSWKLMNCRKITSSDDWSSNYEGYLFRSGLVDNYRESRSLCFKQYIL